MNERTKEIKDYILLTFGVIVTLIVPWILGLVFYATFFYGHRMF